MEVQNSYMNNDSKALVAQAVRQLANVKNKKQNAGNIPNRMIMLFSNGFNNPEYVNAMRDKFEDIWHNSFMDIWYGNYECQNSEVVMKNLNSEEITQDRVRDDISKIRMNKDACIYMNRVNVYNILDTSYINSMDEFVSCFNLYTQTDKLLKVYGDTLQDVGVSNMLILLLDGSLNKGELTKDIRNYVSQHGDSYDGTVVYSDVDAFGVGSSKAELYQIAASVVIISNNDKDDMPDSDNYKKRFSAFYNNSLNTLSYFKKEKPYESIAVKLIDRYMSRIEERYINSVQDTDQTKLRENLGIGTYIDICEKYLDRAISDFDMSLLQHMPFSNPEKVLKMDFDTVLYRDFENVTYKDAFEAFINNYYYTNIAHNIQSDMFNEYADFVRANISAWNFEKITEDDIEKAFDGLLRDQANDDIPLPEYIKKYLKISVRNNIVYPKCKEIVIDLKRRAQQTIEAYNEFSNEFETSFSADKMNQAGNCYSITADNYLNSSMCEKYLKAFVASANSKKDLKNILSAMISENLEFSEDSKSIFSMSFTEDWVKRLESTRAVVYKEIYNGLGNTRDNSIRLGAMSNLQRPQNIKLDVYMMCIPEDSDSSDAQLYNYINDALSNSQTASFMNTGCNDRLEVIKVYDCGDGKLNGTI